MAADSKVKKEINWNDKQKYLEKNKREEFQKRIWIPVPCEVIKKTVVEEHVSSEKV